MDQARAWIAGGYADAGVTGLYHLRLTGGRLSVTDVVAPVRNVSAGVRRGDRWYLVDEVAGEVVVLDAASNWREVARFASGGDAPCHLALNGDNMVLAVANYGDGVTALFTLNESGLPVQPPDRHRSAGNGPVADRQAGPHIHWVGFARDGTLYATDLGSDRVLAFLPDERGLGTPHTAYAAPPGSGPRQIAFHPRLPIAYLVSELASTLSVLDRGADGTWSGRRIVSTLPAPCDSLAGAILLDDDRIHVTNRGHDSVASFAIGADGDVRLLGHRPSGGKSPRFLLADGDRLLIAHEKYGGVTLLPRGSGPLLARADVPGAAFIGESS